MLQQIIIISIIFAFLTSPSVSLAEPEAYFAINPTIRADELRTRTISTRISGRPSIIESNANAALISELTRAGFKYVAKGGEIIIDVSARHGVEVTGSVASWAPFRAKADNESEDISSFSFLATLNEQPIWEASIRVPSEELEGKYTNICIRTLLHKFKQSLFEEDYCEENP